jgi:hypothetical protein
MEHSEEIEEAAADNIATSNDVVVAMLQHHAVGGRFFNLSHSERPPTVLWAVPAQRSAPQGKSYRVGPKVGPT